MIFLFGVTYRVSYVISYPLARGITDENNSTTDGWSSELARLLDI